MIPTDDLVVLLGCACLVSLAFGVLLGVWLCDRRMTKILKGAAEHNLVGSHEYRRKLADLVPNADDLRDVNKKITGLDDLKPGRWL